MSAGDGATRVRVALVIELEVAHGPDPSPRDVRRVVAERFGDTRYLIATDGERHEHRFTRLETKRLHIDVTEQAHLI